MSLSALHVQRRLVPRWRSYAATLRAGELGVPKTEAKRPSGRDLPAERPLEHPELASRLETFGMAPALISAAEAVETAIVSGRETDAVDAARRILTIDKDATPLIRQQAAGLLRRTGHAADVPSDLISRQLADSRRLIRLNPEDPIAWVELALRQTIAKHGRAAMRSMGIALHIAPTNRHVLRSASRLYLHLDDRERAHDVLARNAATRSDPWLMAAEIAVAGAAGRTARSIKLGIATIEDAGLRPHQITELAGALATEELLGGNRKRSRKMFACSMHDPTGNALAHGEWAATQLDVDIVPAARLETVPEAFEAKAFHLYRDGRYADVPRTCEEWAEVDPFSIRPFEFGSGVAGLIDDYDTVERIAEQGLRLRPSAPKLLNAMAFALASSGRPDDAVPFLLRLPKGQDESSKLVTIANEGLIAFRQGRRDDARSYYLEAINGFRRLGDLRMAAQAMAYLARESIAAGEPQGRAILAAAREGVKRHPHPDLKFLLDRIEAAADLRQAEPPVAAARKPIGRITWSTPGLPDRLAGPPRSLIPPPPASPRGTKK